MAEEHKWQEPESHRLCANNCGFFGSPTTFDLCSKCYKDYCLKEQQASQAKLAVEKSFSSYSSSESLGSVSSNRAISQEIKVTAVEVPSNRSISREIKVTAIEDSTPVEVAVRTVVPAVAQSNRCGACRRRVGLTGFNCRCGTTFCGTHRYPEQHGCTFDFKALGREAIAKANPVVVAEKLDKI